MGASYSEPVPSPNENVGYVSVVFRMHDKVRLVNAPPIAVEAITKVIRLVFLLYCLNCYVTGRSHNDVKP